MIISVASGKGGTGKTTIAVNLARTLKGSVTLVDCDVEEPNDHLFLKGKRKSSEIVSNLIPRIDKSLCDGCGECSEFCQFNALAALGTETLVFPELCHSCGGCSLVCPNKAISEIPRRIGIIETVDVDNITLMQGIIDVGVASATPLVRALRKRLINRESMIILDVPPGTSCPVVASIQGTDYVVLVTEPTPFGLNDLKLAVGLVRELEIPFGVIINRMGIGDDRVHKYCENHNIKILLEIPNDRRIAEVYSEGGLIVENVPEYRGSFEGLLEKVEKDMLQNNYVV